MTIQMNVASNTSPARLAGAILKTISSGNTIELLAVGAGAVNQATKAIALANDKNEIKTYAPSFCEVIIDGQEKKGIKIFLG